MTLTVPGFSMKLKDQLPFISDASDKSWPRLLYACAEVVCFRPNVQDGSASQTSAWARRQKLVAWRKVLQNRESHSQWRLHGIRETSGCRILRSQFIFHRCCEQKRPHQLQVKVQGTSYRNLFITFDMNGRSNGGRDMEETDGSFKNNLTSLHPTHPLPVRVKRGYRNI